MSKYRPKPFRVAEVRREIIDNIKHRYIYPTEYYIEEPEESPKRNWLRRRNVHLNHLP